METAWKRPDPMEVLPFALGIAVINRQCFHVRISRLFASVLTSDLPFNTAYVTRGCAKEGSKVDRELSVISALEPGPRMTVNISKEENIVPKSRDQQGPHFGDTK